MLIKGNASGQRSLLTQAMGAATLAMMLAACSATSSTLAQTTGTSPSAGTPAAATAAVSIAAASSAAAATAAASSAAATASTAAAATARTASAASSSPAAAASGLTGTWTGQYSGASSGNFTLHCTQSGSALSGIISLETDGISMPIHGTVAGDSIQFGTVGSTGISYQGQISGNSMSGTYQLTANGTTFRGSWSATKSS
jgi:hypothetical protein